MWQCHSCKAWSSNTRNWCFGCGACKDGQQLVREHVTAQPETGSNVGRTQAPPTAPAHARTEAEEPVRRKKTLKMHLFRSFDKLVAAKEQLPEEEEREVAQGVTRCHRTYQSSPASEGWSHVWDSSQKKRPLHITRSRRRRSNPSVKLCKHAAAQDSCARVEQEIEEEEDEDEECVQDAVQDKGRDPYQEWYNPTAHFSQSAVRTAVSQNSATHSCASGISSSPGHLGSGYTVAIAEDACISVGSACGGNFKLRGPNGGLLADSEEQKKGAGERAGRQSSGKIPQKDAANALQTFRSTSERHRPH